VAVIEAIGLYQLVYPSQNIHFYQAVSSSVSQDSQQFPLNDTRTIALVFVVETDCAQCAVHTVQQQLSSTASLGELSVANRLPCNDSVISQRFVSPADYIYQKNEW
jgi:hypothetical protein